jgi:hypothetical protein
MRMLGDSHAWQRAQGGMRCRRRKLAYVVDGILRRAVLFALSAPVRVLDTRAELRTNFTYQAGVRLASRTTMWGSAS